MTRQECAEKIFALMEEAGKVYRQYQPDGPGISCTWDATGYIGVSDIKVDSETREIKNWTLQASRFEDGSMALWQYDENGLNLVPA